MAASGWPIRLRGDEQMGFLEAAAEHFPDAPVLIDPSASLSFGEFRVAVYAFIDRLRAVGLGQGDVVAVALPNIWEYVALDFAIPALGSVIMPLPLALGSREIESALARSGASLVVTTEMSATETVREVASCQPSVGIVDVGELTREISGFAVTGDVIRDLRTHTAEPDDVVQIALTSGTTGPPKLAGLSAELRQLTFEGFTSRLQIGPDDRVLPLTPITQGAAGMALYSVLAGAALVMTRSPRFSADQVLRLVEETRATVLVGVPTTISRLVDSPLLRQTDLGSLRATAVAGAPMPPDLAAEWEQLSGSRVCGFFGAMDIGQLAVASPDDPPAKRWRTVGRPHEQAEMMICDPAGQAQPPNLEGEICMRGPLVQSRYWGQCEGPFSSDGWAHFGDLGFIDDEGFLHVTGRLKDIIIRAGTNINPHEIEALIREHPRVSDVCIVARKDSEVGERCVAFVVSPDSEPLSLDDLTEYLDDCGVARYKWPEYLQLVDELPLGPTGKVLRRELREHASELPELVRDH
jgi:acyl-CoA synthetase (AMP-forming)/AMP-acid ligase II